MGVEENNREENGSSTTTRKTSRGFLSRNERKLSFLAFIAGFVWDGIFLTQVTIVEASVVLGIYLGVIAIGIIVFNTVESKVGASKWLKRSVVWIPYLIQFMYGTLFNASLIFYTQSAEISASWPFLLFIAIVVLGNELLHRRRHRLTFQIGMFFTAEFLYFVLVVPITVGKMGSEIFIVSGLISLFVLLTVTYFVSRFARPRFEEDKILRTFFVVLIYIVINVLYFTNIIPPIPLSLKSVGVYHSVVKDGNDYKVTYEPVPSYVFWRAENNIFHAMAGDTAYVFSSVFAPTSISAEVFHEWWYFDINNNQLVLVSKIPFKISGGRDGGFRGYSKKEHIYLGDWKVDIVTDQRQLIGRLNFTVVASTTLPILKTAIK